MKLLSEDTKVVNVLKRILLEEDCKLYWRLGVLVFCSVLAVFIYSGCMTSGKVSMRQRMLNAAWNHQEATQREKEAKKEKQKRASARIIREFMNSWIGKPVSSDIREVGPATQITDDGSGGRIYVWEKMSHPPRATTRRTVHWDHYFQRPEYELETVISPGVSNRLMFYTRADGTIYHWRMD